MDWLLNKGLRIALPAILKYGVAFALAHNANSVLAAFGVSVDWSKFQFQVTIVLGTLLDLAHSHVEDKVTGGSK